MRSVLRPPLSTAPLGSDRQKLMRLCPKLKKGDVNMAEKKYSNEENPRNVYPNREELTEIDRLGETEPFHRLRTGECDGECSGRTSHWGRRHWGDGKPWVKVVDGECPNPCDASVLDSLEPIAKKYARLDAIEKCMDSGGPNCICAGGKFRMTKRRCNTIEVDDLDNPGQKKKQCRYEVRAAYEGGTCRLVE